MKQEMGQVLAGWENNMCKGPEGGRDLNSQKITKFSCSGIFKNAVPSAWASFIRQSSWVPIIPMRHSARFWRYKNSVHLPAFVNRVINITVEIDVAYRGTPEERALMGRAGEGLMEDFLNKEGQVWMKLV